MSNPSLTTGDPITSLFHNGNIKVEEVQDVIENKISKEKTYWKSHAMSLNYCYESLNIMSDLIKLQLFYKDSTDFMILNKFIQEKFRKNGARLDHINSIPFFATTTLIQLSEDNTYNEWKYKDNALKSIQKCNKLLIGLESLSINLSDIRHFLNNNMNDLLRDSMTLLVEIWLYLINQFKWFKIKILSTFIRSKCLLINFELQLILDYLVGSKYHEKDPVFKVDVKDKLLNTINSFNHFISDLLQNLDQAIVRKDETSFNESFSSFLDIEVMYTNINFTWLNPKEDQNTMSIDLEEESSKHYLDTDPKDIRDLEHISQYVDNMIELIPEAETQTPLNSPRSRINVPNSLQQQQRMQPQTSRYGQQPASVTITRELPHLLNAFNNVKRLESDIEASSRLFRQGEIDDFNLPHAQTPKIETPRTKRRSQSISSSVSTSSTLYSNSGYHSSSASSSIITASASTIAPTSNTNDDTDINFKNMYSSMTPITTPAKNKLASAYRIPPSTLSTSTKSSQMFMSQPGLAMPNSLSVCATNPLTVSTSMANQSQLLKNDLMKLMSIEEHPSIPNKKSFTNSMIPPGSRVTGFHSVLLNNLYGIGTIRGKNDLPHYSRSKR